MTSISILIDLALAQADAHYFEASAKSYLAAHHLHEKIGFTLPIFTSSQIIIPGRAWGRDGKKAVLQTAAGLKQFLEGTGTWGKTVVGPFSLTLKGVAHARFGEFVEAVASMNEAIELLRAAGTLQTVFGALAIDALARVQDKLQNTLAAEESRCQAR